MNLVEFFGTKVKPKLCRGKYMFAPVDNVHIGCGIYALRDKDVNAFVYRKADDVIAIDCGYKNSENMLRALSFLDIDPEYVSHLFITHLDLDHAGGLDKRCRRLYKNARIYLGSTEIRYAQGVLSRKKIGPFGFNTPIQLSDDYTVLEDMQTEHVGGIKIQAIQVSGHTLGHLCYLVDDRYLFTGDSLILVKGKGYCFYNQWNVDSRLNMLSLQKLKNIGNLDMIITSHSGYTNRMDEAFSHIHELPNWKEKGFAVSDDAPYDPYN